MPLGTIGELCIAGDGLAQGYVGDKELTSNKFSSEWIPGEERVYRTGDMAKWLPDGNIVYHGRNDDHIKIRGFRIHLAEIEKALNSMSDIQQAVVKVSEDQKGAKKLIGYIVSKKEIDNKKIQEILEAELPEYMVPRLYIQLPSFPMTSNGKINKKLLTLPDTKDNFVAPMLQLEKQLALLWQEVLVVEQVGIYDNFYELGGDSIKAIQLASRCKTHGIHVRVKDIFNHQTISSIIFHLKNVDVALQETGFLSGKVTLHPVQKHFFERGYEAIDHYNQAILLKISKTITKEPLVFALTELVKQHDALRMQYCKEENLKYPMQEYGSLIPELFIEEITDLDDIPEICTKYQSDLDIFNGDLTRFVLFKTPEYESENRMLIAIHHLAVDGVSLRILTEDIISLVSDYLSGKTTVLPVKGTSYRQWNNKLSEYATTSILKKEYAYWKKVLSHFTPLPVDLSYDQPITYQETENVQVSLSSSLTHALIHEVNCTYGAEINDILTSALTMALSKWVTVSKVVIGMEGHGREELFKDMDVKRTVGWFTSIYPVCLNVGKVEDIGILIADTKDMLRGVPNRGIGYGVLRFGSDSTKIKSDLSVFYEDLIFNYLGSFDNSFSTEPESLGSLASETTGITIGRQNINPHRISIDSIIIDGRLYVDFNYDVKRYKKETLQKLADSYITALKNIISHSDQLNESDENHVENEDFEIFSL
jgi:non-ribosomal peptide synthase protein (TIGR01720 family)